ncbi:MAG: hypothetical protein JWP12_236 [Bacteroidetes bacterium]|nr:hypothetical protein [Bacteroidota bacterium]
MRSVLCFCLFFSSVFKITAQDAAVFFEKGKQQYETGDYKNALVNFQYVIELQPQLEKINYYAGLSEFNLQDYKQAIVYFKLELALNPAKADVYILLARAEDKSGDMAAAISDLEQGLKVDADNPKLYLEKGNVYFNNKKYKEAIRCYNEVLRLNPKLEQAYYKKGFCNYYLGDTIAARKSWSKLEDPDDYENYEVINKVCTKN